MRTQYRPYKMCPELLKKLDSKKETFPCPQMVVWLSELLLLAQKKTVFQKTSQQELITAQYLFKEILENKFNVIHQKEWQHLGFNTFLKEFASTVWLCVMEKPEHAKGRGFYIFDLSCDSGPILQVPHSFKDWYTSELGLLLFLEKGFKAACWNTVPRNTQPGEKPRDLARFYDSYFTALAKAYSTVHKQNILAQLHGFNPKKRKTPQGLKAEMIISAGTRQKKFWFSELLCKIQKQLPHENIFGFPYEINELGGTLNSVGQFINRINQGRFLHIELAQSERIKLLDNNKLRFSLARALQS